MFSIAALKTAGWFGTSCCGDQKSGPEGAALIPYDIINNSGRPRSDGLEFKSFFLVTRSRISSPTGNAVWPEP